MKLLTSVCVLKLTTLSIFTFLMITGFAQSKNPGEINAEGAAKIKMRPDLAELTLTVEKSDTIEKTTIKSLNLEIDALIKSLYKLGFTDKAIKISDYDISGSSYRDEDDKKRYRLPIYLSSSLCLTQN